MQISSFFPTVIGLDKLDLNINDIKELINIVYKLEKDEKNKNYNQSSMTIHGYHTSLSILTIERPVIQKLKQELKRVYNEYYKTHTGLKLPENVYFYGWGMISPKCAMSKPHVHPNSLISSAFYIKVPKDLKPSEGEFNIQDPRPAATFGFSDLVGPNLHSIKPEAGNIAIFPSWLEHFVTPHSSEEDRISIAINCSYDKGENGIKIK